MEEQTIWDSSFFEHFSPRVQQQMLSLAESRTFAPGETIFREGDPSLYLYLVKRGRIAIEMNLPGRGARTVLVVGPGELFSWSALVEPRVETASARALEESEALAIKGGTLTDACLSDPGFGLELYRTLCEVISARLVATRLHLLDELTWPVDVRPK
ncbi:MAG TPA: cyclic nucleotide-binding domain-containing protein [Candidatus Xenobia bacterium]|nr:cyclic nucleotide-binding domain-containing protein [Candidatus Xenobia bacterium]